MSLRLIGPLDVGADMLLPLTYSELDILWAYLHCAGRVQNAVYGYSSDKDSLCQETNALLVDNVARFPMASE